jgi:hypothetical protein
MYYLVHMYVSENIFCMRIASHMYVFYRPVYRRHSTRYVPGIGNCNAISGQIFQDFAGWKTIHFK